MSVGAKSAELHPRLELRPPAQIHFHEHPEQGRTERLTARLRQDGLLRHPPIVGEIGGSELLLLDGANRVSALKALGCAEIPVQVVNYAEPQIELKGWHHLLLDPPAQLNLGQAFASLAGIVLGEVPAGEVEGLLAFHSAFAVLVEADGRCRALQAAPGAPGPENLLQRVQVMHQVVQCYEGNTRLERIKLADYSQLPQALEGQHSRSLVLFPTLRKEELMQLVRKGAMTPTGLTRHLIPGRALGCNLSLEFLLRPSTPAQRRQHFAHWLQERLGTGRIRFYEESVFMLDE